MPSRVSKYTIVVALLEGRHFPRRQGASVFVQCKFNGESLSTDPVPIGNLGVPVWDTELAWDLDVRALHYLRTNRVPIKVCVFALSAQGSRKALLGNLVLDLRAAQPFPAKEIWAPLIPPPASDPSKTAWIINTMNGTRPELKISFGSGPHGSDVTTSSIPQPLSVHGVISPEMSPQKSVKQELSRAALMNPLPSARHISSISADDKAFTNLHIAVQPDGSYRIGNDEADKLFRLAITLVSIQNLTMLAVLPHVENSDVPGSGVPLRGYFILLQLLGNSLRSQSFTDSKDPSFPEETLTFDLVLGISSLDRLIASLDKLPVYLCYDEQILGTAHIDFPLFFFGPEKHAIPATHEASLDVVEDSSIDLKIQHRPQIVVRISLTELPTEESLGALLDNKNPKPSEISTDNPPNQPEIPLTPARPSFLSTIEESATAPHSPSHSSRRHPPLTSPDHANVPPTIPGVPTHVPSSITALRHNYDHDHRHSPTPAIPSAEAINVPLPSSAVGSLQNNRWHQYRFSIDIKSARDLQPPWHSANVFFKYAYGPFGTKSPFISHPPVQLFRNSAHMEVLLMSGFCAYEFVMAPTRLRTFLDALPLEIFAVHKDIMAKDTVLGAALIDLGKVMDVPKRQTVTKAGQPLDVQVMDHWVNVCASAHSGTIVKVLGIRIILCIEDFGLIEEQAPAHGAPESVDPFANSITIPPSITVGEELAAFPTSLKHATPHHLGSTPAASCSAGSSAPDSAVTMPPTFPDLHHRSTTLMPEQALWEQAQRQVEEWRIRQEHKIDMVIRERDSEAMRELEARLKDREAEHDKKSDEFREVERHLERLLEDMERREHALQREEQNLIDRRMELERDFDGRCAKVEATARKLDLDVSDQHHRDHARIADMERQREAAFLERNEWEEKYRALDKQFFEVKMSVAEAARGAPDARALETQVRELGRKLEGSEKRAEVYKKQRAHFKQQWLNTLAEYAQYKRDSELGTGVPVIPLEPKLSLARSGTPNIRSSQAGNGRGSAADNAVLGTVSVDMKELNEIRCELHRLREGQEQMHQSLMNPTDHASTYKASQDSVLRHPNGYGTDGVPRKLAGEQMVQLECIVQERDLLLRSGVYTAKDHLIMEMNARIQQLSNGVT